MKTRVMLAGGLLLAMTVVVEAQPIQRLGVGANYWTSMKRIKVDNIDRDGFSYYASYQLRPGLLGWQLDFEWLPDRFGEKAYAPAAYVILGRGAYVSAGAGWLRQDGEWADNPFFALRAGLDFELLPNIFMDLGVSYRFDSKTKLSDAVDDIDTDTLYIGAALRLAF